MRVSFIALYCGSGIECSDLRYHKSPALNPQCRNCSAGWHIENRHEDWPAAATLSSRASTLAVAVAYYTVTAPAGAVATNTPLGCRLTRSASHEPGVFRKHNCTGPGTGGGVCPPPGSREPEPRAEQATHN